MKRLQAYKFMIRPSADQAELMAGFAGQRRYVWNRALAMHRERHEDGEAFLGYAAMCRELTAWRSDSKTPWLREGSVSSQQQVIKDLDQAYKRFFKGLACRPVFKKRFRSNESFRFPRNGESVRLDQRRCRVRLPKLGQVKYVKSRNVEGTLKNVTVSRKAGDWFVSIQTEREVADPVHPSTSAVGVDVGIASFAALSTGELAKPLNSFRKHGKRLARAQRKLARKVRFSNNWKKQRGEISKIHCRIGNARNDYLHKLSSTVSKSHAIVCVEDLKVSNMSRSASGTVEDPGKRVAQKRGLNKAILDQGWGEFRRQLAYKLEWLGGELVAVNPAYTSQQCSECRHVAKESRRTQAHFKCVVCGHEDNADVNAAKNILAAGIVDRINASHLALARAGNGRSVRACARAH